jgi:hypothetical protein
MIIDAINITRKTTQTDLFYCMFLVEVYDFPLAVDHPPKKTTPPRRTSHGNINFR